MVEVFQCQLAQVSMRVPILQIILGYNLMKIMTFIVGVMIFLRKPIKNRVAKILKIGITSLQFFVIFSNLRRPIAFYHS